MSQNNEQSQNTKNDVLAEVAGALQKSTGEVRSRLVNMMTEREIVKRVNALDAAMAKREKLANEVSSIRPPGKKTYALVEGKMQEVLATYTADEKKKFDEDMKQYTKKLKEATEKLERFDSLLEKAFSGAPEELEKTFAKLIKATAGDDKGGGEKSEEETQG